VAALAVLLVAGCGGSSSHNGDPSAGKVSQAAARKPVPASVVPAPGGAVQTGGVVARVGEYVITRSAFENRMRIELLSEPPAERILPVPPAFTGCIARLAKMSASTVAASRPSSAALKSDCEGLYRRLLRRVLDPLISAYWVMGGAREMGITVSDAQLRQQLDALKGPRFNTEAAFQKLLAQTGENVPDMLFNLRDEVLEGAIRARVEATAGPITPARIARYYAENKAAYAVPELRDLGFIHTRNLATAQQVKRELASGVSFARIAKRLANEQPHYAPEGILSELHPHEFKIPALNDAIFAARAHVLSGPVHVNLGPAYDVRLPHDIQDIDGYYVFEVQSIKPAYEQSFAQVKASIAQELPLTLKRQAVAAFVAKWRRKWVARTDCSPGYVVRKCRQFKPVPGETPEDAYTIN
jgi:parvulin-like peptidyl-prolyl isomerase